MTLAEDIKKEVLHLRTQPEKPYTFRNWVDTYVRDMFVGSLGTTHETVCTLNQRHLDEWGMNMKDVKEGLKQEGFKVLSLYPRNQIGITIEGLN